MGKTVDGCSDRYGYGICKDLTLRQSSANLPQILNMHLYVPWMLDDVDSSSDETEKPALGKPGVKNYGKHKMLDKHHGTPDITQIVKAQIKAKMGRMIVSGMGILTLRDISDEI